MEKGRVREEGEKGRGQEGGRWCNKGDENDRHKHTHTHKHTFPLSQHHFKHSYYKGQTCRVSHSIVKTKGHSHWTV